MARVFFINPSVQISKKEYIRFLRDYSGGEIPTSMVYPPLDMAYAAALLRSNGHPVALLDASTLNMPPSEAVKKTVQYRPDFVGIPSAWASIHSDLELSKGIKDKLPSVKIVMWGVNVTVDPELALSCEHVDYVILGEPERAFLNIVNGVLVENTAYKSGSGIILTKRALDQDLDLLPFPARDLLPNDKYVAPYVQRNPFTTISTSRGCPYSKCTFCPSNVWYMDQVRYRSVGNVMEEIDEIVNKFKINSIIFRDQSLTFEEGRLIELCDEVIDKDYPISWRCFSGVKAVNKKLLSLMKKAGCYQINYGFENGSQDILDLSNKGITLEESESAARLTREAGIELSGSFMLGMFGDTDETINKTIDFAIKLGCDYAEFLPATPLPSTKFYEQCGLSQKSSLSAPPRWYNRYYNSDMLLNEELLHRRIRKAYRRFYFRPGYIYRRFHRAASFQQLFLQSKLAVSLFKKIFL